MAVLVLLAAAPVVFADFEQDLRALTRDPHRLSGTEEGRRAADYIEQRLRAIGVNQVYPLDMIVWQTDVDRCELQIGGRTVPLLPMQPNVVANPVTEPEGLTGRLIYVGDGRIEDYGDTAPEDSGHTIVAMDYDSGDNWEKAVALGADAVIFIGEGDETPLAPKHVGIPANQIRLYARAADLEGVDLARPQEATIHSRVTWDDSILGRNLAAFIPGTDPDFAAGRDQDEVLVLAAHYDSFGAVPQLSPGARSAANVAALLEAAEALRTDPPKRDVLLLFLDNQSRYHQGAREVYDALMMTADTHDNLVREHAEEQAFVASMRDTLATRGLTFGRGVRLDDADASEAESAGAAVLYRLSESLRSQADFFRDDLAKELQVLRLEAREFGGSAAERLEANEETMQDEQFDWDAIRRALHSGVLATFVDEKRAEAEAEDAATAAEARQYLALFDRLTERTLSQFDRRLAELELITRIDAQRDALRSAMADKWIVLHTTYNFSGGAPTWGVIVGDWTDRLFKAFRRPKPEGDTPGYYGRVLNAFRDAIAAAGPEVDRERIENRSLTDPTLGTTIAPGPFFSSGYVAGLYGIYNVSLMTAHDARVRSGHPADTVENLPWPALREQALQGTRVVRRLADAESLSLPRVFKPFSRSKYPSWSGNKPSGDYVGLQVSGSLSEDRPAAGALLATWPGSAAPGNARSDAWNWLREAAASPAFTPILLSRVDSNGRFAVIGYQSEMMIEIMAIAALFDEQGQITAISNRDQQGQKSNAAMRVDLMTGEGYTFSTLPTYDLKPSQLKVLRAMADAEFRGTRALWGQQDGHSFFYVSDYSVEDSVKVFQPMGPVVLGRFDEDNTYGTGVPRAWFEYPQRLSLDSAEDLWQLNETRFAQLRRRGVTSADLEFMHSRAAGAMQEAQRLGDDASVAGREAALMRSAVLSHRVYQPLRQAMDDLVHAIVILLLLAIPFAFALERLVVCATTIYGRIAGFTVFFLLTFGILYFTHPGFAIASTPIIIFLAFAIILLSALVIYIVVRKFQTELKAMQGQSVGVHSAEVSATGTLLAAVGMGMSTMRRRPTRTTLTAVTVVALTFTILSFASFSREIGVRSIPSGLKSEQTAADILLRKLDYSEIPQGVLTMLAGQEGRQGLIASHWWLVRRDADTPPFGITRVDDGRSVQLEAVMGVSPAELERWPALTEALGEGDAEHKRAALQRGGVFLPYIVQQMLDLEPGDEILFNGHRASFAGVIDGVKLQTLKHVDGESVIPVDFQTATLEGSSGGNAAATEEELLMADDVEKDFVHLSADQVAIASAQQVEMLGGRPHLVAVYPGLTAAGDKIDAGDLGAEIARTVVMPVWAAGIGGVERLLLTVVTEVSGGLALFVPLLLGGLIIFGTLLGSIQDREKEIYTFSALGLSPGHVGVLFFAEATVYAVVGGMGGQLLAQFVALTASALARAGYIQPANINYSSTNALFAIGVVMLTVIVSAIYPAMRASRSANPGLARTWRLPPAEDDQIKLTFPFTVSAYDITGVISFLAEHFRRHDDAGLGNFAASNVQLGRNDDGYLYLESDLALAPFDLGVTQHLVLTAVPSEIEGVDEVAIAVDRLSGARGDWYRANKVFMRDLRKQFLLWRTLSTELIENYRMETLETLGEGRRRPDAPENPTGFALGPKPLTT